MGNLFGSSAKNTVSNIYDTTTNTTQTDLSGNSGLNLQNASASFDSNDTTVINNTELNQSIDGGALDAAAGIAAGAFDTLTRGLGSLSDSSDRAFAFGDNALARVAQLNSNSLDLFAELAGGAIESSRTLARDASDANAEATKTAIDGFGALAKQSSESTDDKVSKVAAYGLAAIAAILILPAIFKGGGSKAVIA